MDSLSERLRFLLSTKAIGQSAFGSKPFATLERRTGISADKWRNFMRGKQRATDELIVAVGAVWPWYVYWLVTGSPVAVEQLNPVSETRSIEIAPNDIVLERAKSPDQENQVNVKHALKLREDPYGPSILPLTSDNFEWGYFGAGPCELAANILYAFGLPELKAIQLREKFARDIVSNLDRTRAVLKAQQVQDWIAANNGTEEN